jgi:predicted PurR-regulated permease PerM
MAKEQRSSPLFILVAMLTALAALYFAREILLPIALAVLLSFLLTPLANRLESWKVPRVLSVVLVVAMAFSVLGLLGWVVTDQLVELGRQLPANKQNLINKTKWVSDTFIKVRSEIARFGNFRDHTEPQTDNRAETRSPIENRQAKRRRTIEDESRDATSPLAAGVAKVDQATDMVEPPAEKEAIPVTIVDSSSSPVELVQGWLGPLVAPFATTFIVIILTLFMLFDREGQRSRLIQLFGRSHLHATTEAVHDVAKRVGRYLRSLFLVYACYGIVIAVGLWAIGVPNAMLWGVLAFAMRFLPYLGPWIAALVPILISIATADGWLQPIIVFGWYLLVELVVYNFIEPFVYGSVIGVSTVGILVTALFWTWLWGPIGLLLAMPMTVCMLVAARYIPQLRFLTILLADQPPLSPPEHVYQRLLAFDYLEPMKLAHRHLKDSSLSSYYDEVLIPALRMSEHDRHDDLLNDEQAAFVVEAAEDLVQELGDEAFAAIEAKAHSTTAPSISINDARSDETPITARVLCIPLRDQADETASHMLAQLLVAEGFDVATESAKATTGELVDRVAESKCELVVISVVPPIGPRDTRLLWRRLRQHFPELPIVMGLWTGAATHDDTGIAENDSVTKIATTLAEAVTLTRALAAQLKLTVKTA